MKNQIVENDSMKRCCRCGNISLKSNFHKNKLTEDGLGNQCRLCWKQYCLDDRDRKKHII